MKNYKIFFHDGKIEYTTKEKYFKIVEESGNPSAKKFFLNQNMYSFSDVKRMEEPKPDGYDKFNLDEYLKKQTPERRMHAIEQMAKGLKAYIKSDRHWGTQAPLLLLEKFRKQYIQAKLELNK